MNNPGQILLTVLNGYFVRSFITIFVDPAFYVALRIARVFNDVRVGGHTSTRDRDASLPNLLTKLLQLAAIDIVIQQRFGVREPIISCARGSGSSGGTSRSSSSSTLMLKTEHSWGWVLPP